MKVTQIWREAATLVREIPHDGLPRELVHEGPLWEVLLYVDRLDESDQRPLTIALPDRRAPPLRFEHAEIAALLRRHDRPGFGNVR
ncbi:hypothetical protein [Sphingomonas sp.]|uniref:hypothetical protein n=1 Tax=Sphingomonas sp. TaxID=28214 RepID=UPI002ED9A067